MRAADRCAPPTDAPPTDARRLPSGTDDARPVRRADDARQCG